MKLKEVKGFNKINPTKYQNKPQKTGNFLEDIIQEALVETIYYQMKPIKVEFGIEEGLFRITYDNGFVIRVPFSEKEKLRNQSDWDIIKTLKVVKKKRLYVKV